MSKRIGILSVCLVLLLVAGSVAVARPLAHKKIVEDTGTIKCVKEIYLIYGDRGTYFAGRLWKIYYPVNLPERFKKDGLRVRFKGYVAFHPGIWKDLAKVRESLPKIPLVLPIKIVSIEELHEEISLKLSLKAKKVYSHEEPLEVEVVLKNVGEKEAKVSEFILGSTLDIFVLTPDGRKIHYIGPVPLIVPRTISLKPGEEMKDNVNLRKGFGDEDGIYEYIPGSYRATAMYKIFSSDVRITSNTVSFIILPEKEPCRIYGRVIDAESGEGIKGARVKAREFITYTGDDGYYELILPAGKYVVEVSKRGYEKARKEVYLKEGEEKEINFELRRVEEKLAIIHGRVFEVSGELRKPLPGARVMLFKIKSRIVVPMALSIASRYGIVKPVYQTKTNESGYYELKVKPGSYIGIAVKDGYRPDVKKILAKAGEDIEVNFELRKPRFPLFPIIIR